MNEIKVFENEQFGSIRTVTIDGQPWFVGRDVAQALGYSNTKDALMRHVDDDDKLRSCFTTSGQRREMTVINESGLYSLILSSKLETAKQFKRWVTSEVLPSIRKYGAYATEETLDRVQGNTEESEKLFTLLREEKQRTRELENENNRLIEENDTLTEVVDFINMYEDESELLNASDIALAYKMSVVEFNRLLSVLGIQYRAFGTWRLTPQYEGYGYVRTDRRVTFGGRIFIHTRWTVEGARFLYHYLKQHDILPVFNWIGNQNTTN